MSDQDSTSAEQAADLAALTSAAAEGAPQALEQAPGQAQSNEPQPPSAAAMQIAAMLVGIVRPIAIYAVPGLREAPAELWEPVPEGVAGVLDLYGANAEWMQSPWARLAFSLAPLAAFAAVKAMDEKPKAKPQSIEGTDLSAQAQTQAAGSKTVTIGAAVPAEVAA